MKKRIMGLLLSVCMVMPTWVLADKGAEQSSEAYNVLKLMGLAEKDADEIARIQTELDALYATADARAKSVAEKLANGADFDDMIDQYGEDAGMKDASIRARGYAIAKNSPLWAQNVRAAAMACARNAAALFVPCHRVLAASGALTGYAGGLDAKLWLLQHEGVLL